MDSLAEEGKFGPIEATKGKESLSQKELENLIVSMGNSEAKALTLLLMKPGQIYTVVGLQKEILAAQGAKPGWKTSFNVCYGYCFDSFEPIGLVAMKLETMERNWVTLRQTKVLN